MYPNVWQKHTKAQTYPNVVKCMTWISSIDLDLWSISPILWPANHSCSLFRYKSSHFRYFPPLSSVFSWQHLSGGYQECRWQRLASSQLGLGMVTVTVGSILSIESENEVIPDMIFVHLWYLCFPLVFKFDPRPDLSKMDRTQESRGWEHHCFQGICINGSGQT